eukprot:1189949-Prorocentrum_minimum.AAC.4
MTHNDIYSTGGEHRRMEAGGAAGRGRLRERQVSPKGGGAPASREQSRTRPPPLPAALDPTKPNSRLLRIAPSPGVDGQKSLRHRFDIRHHCTIRRSAFQILP